MRILRVLLLLALSLPTFAQTYNLFNSPHQQWLDNNGKPLAGGKLYSYAAGTSTNQTTYQDTAGTVNTNPIVLDSAGFATVYLVSTQSYKFRMTNAQGVQVWTVDNIAGTTGTISTVPLNSILPATGTNTIANGNNAQNWQWQSTGSTTSTMFSFTENAASTNTGAASSLVNVGTLAGSTLWPLRVYANAGAGANGFGVAPTTGNVTTFGAAQFMGPLTGNVTGNVSGTAGSLAGTPTQCTSVTQYATGIAPNGNANCNPFTAVFASAPPITGTTATFTGAVSTGPLTSTTGTFSGAVTGASLKATGLAGTPSCVQTDATGLLTLASGLCGTPNGPASSVPLNGLTVALANNTISNAAFTQTWNWVLTGASNGMVFGEQSAGAGTGAVVQINGLSNAVTPLDVEGSGTASQIHFGVSPLHGGWLASPSGASPDQAQLSGGMNYVGSSFVARATSTALFITNGIGGGTPGGFQFYGDTGKIVGQTFAPTPLETIAPVTGGTTVHTLYAGGNPVNSILSYPSAMMLLGTATYDGTSYIARSATPLIFAENNGAFLWYADSGRTPGAAYTPTQVANMSNVGVFNPNAISTSGNTTTGSLNVTTNSAVTGTETVGRFVVASGVIPSGGMKHQRFASCTTTAVVNGSCSGTMSWTAQFPDANYTVVCNTFNFSNGPTTVAINSISALGMAYTLINIPPSAVAATAGIACIAMHD